MIDEIKKLELLKAEYLQLQNMIEAFDEKTLTIKAWSITTSLAGIGTAFVSKSGTLLLIAAISSLLFWLIEGFWKSFQYSYYDRVKGLEQFFNGENPEIIPMQIAKSWYEQFKKDRIIKLFRIMFWPWVALPHVFVSVTGIVLYILFLYGIIAI